METTRESWEDLKKSWEALTEPISAEKAIKLARFVFGKWVNYIIKQQNGDLDVFGFKPASASPGEGGLYWGFSNADDKTRDLSNDLRIIEFEGKPCEECCIGLPDIEEKEIDDLVSISIKEALELARFVMGKWVKYIAQHDNADLDVYASKPIWGVPNRKWLAHDNYLSIFPDNSIKIIEFEGKDWKECCICIDDIEENKED